MTGECNNKNGVNPAEESVRDIVGWVKGTKTKRAWGAEYAPILLPSRYAKVSATQATLYFLLSTWNPYQVVLMRTQVTSVP